MTCASCGRAYIPDPPVDSVTPPPADATGTDRFRSPGGGATDAEWSQPPAAPPSGVPASVPAESRNWAMAAHASALAGVLLGGLPAFLGPLVIWLLRRDQRDPFATEHARHALNFNLSVIVYVIAAVLLSVLTLGLGLLVVVPLGALAFVGYLVVTIRAAMAASRGEWYRYPLTISLVS